MLTNIVFNGTSWKNNAIASTGGVYGIRMRSYRDFLASFCGGARSLYVEFEETNSKNFVTIIPSFWKTQPILRGSAVERYFVALFKQEPFWNVGNPVVFDIEYLGGRGCKISLPKFPVGSKEA